MTTTHNFYTTTTSNTYTNNTNTNEAPITALLLLRTRAHALKADIARCETNAALDRTKAERATTSLNNILAAIKHLEANEHDHLVQIVTNSATGKKHLRH